MRRGTNLLIGASMLAACLRPDTELPPAESGAVRPQAKAASRAIYPPQTRLLWNGDDPTVSTGAGSASCSKPDADCATSIVTLSDIGRDGTAGIKLSGKGRGWMVAHYSWTNRAERSIADISGYGALAFSIRVEAAAADLGPPPKSTQISLAGAPEQMGGGVPIEACKADFSDGGWHRVVIPLAEFQNVDLTQIHGLMLTVHSESPRDFAIYLDDVAVEMLDPANAGCEHPARGDRPFLARYPCDKADEVAATRPPMNAGNDTEMGRVQPVVRANFSRFRECYEKGLARDATLSGQVTVEFFVAADGSVSRARAICTSLPDETTVDCVVGVSKMLRFPSSEHGRIAYPLRFIP